MNKKVVIFVLILVLVTICLFAYNQLIKPMNTSLKTSQSSSNSKNISEQDKPQIVSTKPEPLEEAIISATEVIEITFNRPLENIGEFKVRLEPEDVKYKLELSGDRKTGKIIPEKPYELGASFTLFIGPETKFDGVGRWGEEKIFHFKTIRYRGI